MRDSLIFYRSFYEAINELPKETQAEVYHAIFEFSLNYKEIELSGLSKTIFTLIKPQLKANNKRFENGTKPKHKQNESKTEAKDKQDLSKSEANNNNNVNNNKNKKDNDNKFTPPTLSEVQAYFIENGYTLESSTKAFNYYDTAQWKDSKGNKVKSWKQKMQGVWFKDENKIKVDNGIEERFTPSGQRLIIPY
jgi:hypothetical protein